MNPETWKLVLSAAVFVLTTITGPILWMLRSESRAQRAELKAATAELKLEIAAVRGEIKTEMAEMEKRLNERIDTRLVHR